jgi:hypothetical protein
MDACHNCIPACHGDPANRLEPVFPFGFEIREGGIAGASRGSRSFVSPCLVARLARKPILNKGGGPPPRRSEMIETGRGIAPTSLHPARLIAATSKHFPTSPFPLCKGLTFRGHFGLLIFERRRRASYGVSNMANVSGRRERPSTAGSGSHFQSPAGGSFQS